MIYLLDSNTLIEAKNRYYSMKVCPAYWSWVQRSYVAGVVASIEPVGSELKRGNDELAEWAKKRRGFSYPLRRRPLNKPLLASLRM